MPNDHPVFDCEEHGQTTFGEGVEPYCPACEGQVPAEDDPALEAKP